MLLAAPLPALDDRLRLLRGTAVHDAMQIMPHKASSTHKDCPVRVGINWDGRALPVLADGEKMSKNAAVGGVLAVLAALFVAARNPANQATVTDWFYKWVCNRNSFRDIPGKCKIAGDSDGDCISVYARKAFDAERRAFLRIRQAVFALYAWYTDPGEKLSDALMCMILLNGALHAAFQDAVTPDKKNYWDEAFRTSMLAAAEADVARMRSASFHIENPTTGFVCTPFDKCLLSVVGKDCFIKVAKDNILAALHAVLRGGECGCDHVHMEILTAAILTDPIAAFEDIRAQTPECMKAIKCFTELASGLLQRVKLGVDGGKPTASICPLLESSGDRRFEIFESTLADARAHLPPLFIALDAVSSAKPQLDLPVAANIVSAVRAAALDKVRAAEPAGVEDAPADRQCDAENGHNSDAAGVAPMDTATAACAASLTEGVDRRNSDAVADHMEHMDIPGLLDSLPQPKHDQDRGMRLLLRNLDKPFPADGKPVKIGFDCLKEANLTHTTEGRVLGAVKRALEEKGAKVQWVEGPHASRKTKKSAGYAGRNQHFCAKNAQEWAVIIGAVCSLVAPNRDGMGSSKPKKTIVKKEQRLVTQLRDVPNVSEKTAKKLAAIYQTADDLKKASQEEIANIEHVGEQRKRKVGLVAATSIKKAFPIPIPEK